MRNPWDRPSLWTQARRYLSNWRGLLATAAAIIGVASAGVWLYRDARSVTEDFGPAEGSLRVNINTATQDELESVPGIGPTRAAQIIAGRPYTSVDELERLDGIGPNQVESLRSFLKTDGETERK
jgi:competence ComEA-like helix-hairpin-helix protein